LDSAEDQNERIVDKNSVFQTMAIGYCVVLAQKWLLLTDGDMCDVKWVFIALKF